MIAGCFYGMDDFIKYENSKMFEARYFGFGLETRKKSVSCGYYEHGNSFFHFSLQNFFAEAMVMPLKFMYLNLKSDLSRCPISLCNLSRF